VNFAATRDVNWYHPRLDDLAHMNARTIQHHSDAYAAPMASLAINSAEPCAWLCSRQ
jgi:hypothetical protein